MPGGAYNSNQQDILSFEQSCHIRLHTTVYTAFSALRFACHCLSTHTWQVTGCFCSPGPQSSRPLKALSYIAALFLPEHSNFSLKERRMCEVLMCIQVPFCYKAFSHVVDLAVNISKKTTYLKNELRSDFSRHFWANIRHLNSVWYPCLPVQTWLSNEKPLDNNNIPTGSIGFLYLAINNSSKGTYCIFLLLQLVLSVIKINRYRLLYSLHQNLCGMWHHHVPCKWWDIFFPTYFVSK